MASVQATGAAIDPGAILGMQQLRLSFCRESQRTANHINQLESPKYLWMEGGALEARHKICNAGDDMTIRNQHTHAVRDQESSHHKPDSVFAPGNTKDFFILVSEEVGEFLLEHQCYTGQMFQRWDHPPILQLGEKARGKANLSSKLRQAHGTL